MLKKLLSIGAALVMGLCLFCGCGKSAPGDNSDKTDNTDGGDSDTIDYLKGYDDGSLFESVTAETEGTLYSLEEAYEIGFLSQRDLKKISYFYDADNHAAYPVELFDPVEAAIKNTYAEEWNADESNSPKATSEDFSVVEFYGYYDKCCIVTVDNTLWNYPSYPTEEPNYYIEIGGVQFHVTSNFFPKVWIPNSYFYTLDEGYRYGWLTDSDLNSIAYYYYENDQSVHLGKYGTPKPKDPETLSAETEQQIKEAFRDYLIHSMKFSSPDMEAVNIYKYYGTYNDCVVVGIKYDYLIVDPIFEEEHSIGSVTFDHNFSNWYFKVWHSKVN